MLKVKCHEKCRSNENDLLCRVNGIKWGEIGNGWQYFTVRERVLKRRHEE